MNIAIIGATGLVGGKILQVLEERNIRFDNLYLFANRNLHKKIKVFDREIPIRKLCMKNIEGGSFDYVFFASDASVSKEYAKVFIKKGAVVIDNSNAFRREEKVPLIVPSVNGDGIGNSRLIANPNCSTIQLVTALKPLHDKFKLKRVIVSTYQAVSGAGRDALLDLKKNTTNKFSYPIVNNVIPHIDDFLPNGYTKEEDKLIFESRKILSLPKLNITATAVRVPIKNGHSESVNIEFERKATRAEIVKAMEEFSAVKVVDAPESQVYPMPLYATGKDDVFVGRIRKDYSHSNTFNFWVVADNLRRGAASNAVDIFEWIEGHKNEKTI